MKNKRLKLSVPEEFKSWWNKIGICNLMALNGLGSNEHWYSLDFGRHLIAKKGIKVTSGKDYYDLVIKGDISIEFKVVWNNSKFISIITRIRNSIMHDVKKLKEPQSKEAYLIIIFAFENKHKWDKCGEKLPKIFTKFYDLEKNFSPTPPKDLRGNKKWRLKLQPSKEGDDFNKFSNSLAKYWQSVVAEKADIALKNIKIKVKGYDSDRCSDQWSWCEAILWQVK